MLRAPAAGNGQQGGVKNGKVQRQQETYEMLKLKEELKL
jgi:hypothetical protein